MRLRFDGISQDSRILKVVDFRKETVQNEERWKAETTSGESVTKSAVVEKKAEVYGRYKKCICKKKKLFFTPSYQNM